MHRNLYVWFRNQYLTRQFSICIMCDSIQYIIFQGQFWYFLSFLYFFYLHCAYSVLFLCPPDSYFPAISFFTNFIYSCSYCNLINSFKFQSILLSSVYDITNICSSIFSVGTKLILMVPTVDKDGLCWCKVCGINYTAVKYPIFCLLISLLINCK